jgi:probable rRNA maturation factor
MRSATKPAVYFFFETPVTLANRTTVKKQIASIFKSEGVRLHNLNYIFTTDSRVLKINQDFLKHNTYTDIITFELNRKGHPIDGEIYISVDRVRENARTFDVSLKKELLRVILHGVLHLCGYKDKTPAQIKKIRLKEEFYLRAFSKSNPQ